MRAVLALSVFVLGGCGLAYEYVLGALGHHLMGSGHEALFVVIGIMLFTMGLGAKLQAQMEDQLFDRFLQVECALGLIGGFSANVIHAAHASFIHHQLVLYTLVAVIGLFIGLEIPLILRLNAEYARSLQANLSDILALDYLGALVGALVFTYVLLTRMSLARISFLLGLTNFFVAFLGYLVFAHVLKQPRFLLALLLGGGLALGLGFFKANDWTAAVEQRYYRDPIVHSETTRYQHLVITERGERVNFYINGHLQFSSLDEHIYHELLVHAPMSLLHRPKRVLVLGGGDGLAVREILKYPSVEEIVLVDLDPRMTELAREHPALKLLNHGAFESAKLRAVPPGDAGNRTHSVSVSKGIPKILDPDKGPPDQARVELVHRDADLFLNSVEGFFDAIIVDFPDPNSLELAKLYSRRFYVKLRRALKEGGLVAIQSTSPYFARDAFLIIGETLRSAGWSSLPYHAHVPSFGEWGFHLAWTDARTAKNVLAQLRAKASLPSSTRYLSPEVLKAAFVWGKDRLVSDFELKPSTLLEPTILRAYREGWDGAK